MSLKLVTAALCALLAVTIAAQKTQAEFADYIDVGVSETLDRFF